MTASQSLFVAFQMDPIGSININADSSFRLAEEAQARGHRLFYYTPDQLSYQEGCVMARGQDLVLRREVGNHFDVGEMREQDLSEVDVIWLRNKTCPKLM